MPSPEAATDGATTKPLSNRPRSRSRSRSSSPSQSPSRAEVDDADRAQKRAKSNPPAPSEASEASVATEPAAAPQAVGADSGSDSGTEKAQANEKGDADQSGRAQNSVVTPAHAAISAVAVQVSDQCLAMRVRGTRAGTNGKTVTFSRPQSDENPALVMFLALDKLLAQNAQLTAANARLVRSLDRVKAAVAEAGNGGNAVATDLATDLATAPATAPATGSVPAPMPTPLSGDWKQALHRELAQFELVLRQDIRDVQGREFVPGGAVGASMLGVFPHYLHEKADGPRFFVIKDKPLCVEIRLAKRSADGSISQHVPIGLNSGVWTDETILQILRKHVPAELQRDQSIGGFRKLGLALSLCFAPDDEAEGPGRRVCPEAGEECDFKAPHPRNGRVFSNKCENLTGEWRGHIVQDMSAGNCKFKTRIEAGAYTSYLKDPSRAFVLCIQPTNKILAEVPSFRCMSVPFQTRDSTPKGLSANERYIIDADGSAKASPREHAPPASVVGKAR